VHAPEHAPATHAELEQAIAVPHWPFDPHVWTPLPMHCVAPGAQTPVQAPDTQASPLHAAGAPHVPLEVQV
jgi:hypothetical protein